MTDLFVAQKTKVNMHLYFGKEYLGKNKTEIQKFFFFNHNSIIDNYISPSKGLVYME